jgi:hypothetical protein
MHICGTRIERAVAIYATNFSSSPLLQAGRTEGTASETTRCWTVELVWVPAVTGWDDYNSVGCLLAGTGSEVACSGLGLEEQICPLVLMGLALAEQKEHFGTHTHLHTIITMIGTELQFIKQHWWQITLICHKLEFHFNNVEHFVSI